MDSSDWDARYREKELVWSAGPNRFLVEELRNLVPGRALDIACGEGRNALWLAQNGFQVSAFDYSPVAIEKARARATELGLDIDFQIADATLAIEGEFDLILVFYLHLVREEMKLCLTNAARALAPGGTLLLVGHDRRNIKEGIGGPQDPSLLYGPDDIRGFLGELEIERAETVKRPVVQDGVEREALDVLVRATSRPGITEDDSGKR